MNQTPPAPSSARKIRSVFQRFAFTVSAVGILAILLTFLFSINPLRDLTTTTNSTLVIRPSKSRDTNFSGILARAFPPAENKTPSICQSPYKNERFINEGILMVKPSKVGGSTAASINLRIATTLAQSKPWDLCQTRFDHGKASSYRYGERNRNKSFLWTIIRDPTSRFISEFFFFQVSREGVEPTDENFFRFVHSGGRGHYFSHYFDHLSTQKYKSTSNPVETANNIMDDYDFVAITERMDESAVVLQMMLGLPTASILYMSSKVNGGYDDGIYNHKCYMIQKKHISPFMKQYFDSPQWKEKNKWAEALHQAANRSLDLTIDRLGRSEFEEKLERFRQAQAVVSIQCVNSTRLPCSSEGELRSHDETNCLFFDMGCNFACLDKVADELYLW